MCVCVYIRDYNIIETQDLSNVTRLATTVSGHPSTNENKTREGGREREKKKNEK